MEFQMFAYNDIKGLQIPTTFIRVYLSIRFKILCTKDSLYLFLLFMLAKSPRTLFNSFLYKNKRSSIK